MLIFYSPQSDCSIIQNLTCFKIIEPKLQKISMIKIFTSPKISKFHNFNINSPVTSYFFSNSVQTTSYPYTFGGLKNVQFTNNQAAAITIKQLFGEETIEGFKEAYKFTLYSISQKDRKSLENICEPSLIKNISFKNVQLVNPDANIEVVCGKSFKAFGATFVRESTTQLKSMNSDDNGFFYLNLGLMNPSNPGALMTYISSGLPILMGYEILFKSTMKLVPEGSKKNQHVPEIHSIQFEVEGKMNVTKYMKMAMSMSSGKSNVDYNEAKKILKEMIGNNFEWKVGDIDKALKGNLKVVA